MAGLKDGDGRDRAAMHLADAFDRLRLPLRWTGDVDLRPKQAMPGDAGLDLTVAEAAVIEPGTFADVDLGVSVELPEGVWAMLTGRSSTIRKRGLLVAQGVIDQGYRGPLYAGVWNLTQSLRRLERGDRVAQLIPMPLVADSVVPLRVTELGESERGTQGFGSTGD